MKKVVLFSIPALICASLILTPNAFAEAKHFEGKGEVTSVDPLYSRISIKHGAIKGFAGDSTTDFPVASTKLIENLSNRDLVEFSLTDNRGDVQIDKITKVGVAEKVEESSLGKIAQDVLVGTGEVAKGVTQPIQPVHEVVSGAVGATTGATGTVLEGSDGEGKSKF